MAYGLQFCSEIYPKLKKNYCLGSQVCVKIKMILAEPIHHVIQVTIGFGNKIIIGCMCYHVN